MASTRDIKRKIKSVSNTRQITKAMELVSTSKLRKAKSKLDITKPYFDTVLETIKSIIKNEKSLKHKYLVKREKKNVLYIIIAADRGLCGGYNSNVLKEAVNQIRKNDSNAKLIIVGKQAANFFKDSPHKIIKSFLHISEEPTFLDAKQIASMALRMHDKELIDEINLVYTRMITSLSLIATTLTLLPVKINIEDDEDIAKDEMRDLVSYEPSAEEVLDFIIPKYIESVIYGALIESSAAEQSARRIAMENASDNADEMIDELSLTYNKARQAAITQEITEIVGGAEALK
ncbi:MAG: ATP synthase F1 subunit gamma [Bacillota bacterium]|nr:ATP synthase F1 subunit gamma [Bacillota bacterium]